MNETAIHGISVVHCADLHLGRRLAGLGVLADERRSERLQSFFDLVRRCEHEEVALLLIAGDFLEAGEITEAAVLQIIDALSMLSQTRVFIAPGNHDPYTMDSPYARYEWPSNVVIFRGGVQAVELPELRVRVLGTGFTATYQHEPLFDGAAVPPRDVTAPWVQIGITHGETVGTDGTSAYHPVAVKRLSESGLDYLALGHIHRRTAVIREGRMAYAYPGTHDGGGFDETGEQGCLAGRIGAGFVKMDFIPLSTRRFECASLDISGAASLPEVRAVLDRFFDGFGGRYRQDYLRLTLTGGIDPGLRLSTAYLSGLYADRVHALTLTDQTHPDWDYEQLAQEPTLRGMFTREMLNRQISAEADDIDIQEVLADALRFGLSAFDGEVSADEA